MHRGGLAFYLLTALEDQLFYAELYRYDGKTSDLPPPKVMLSKKKDRWIANCDEVLLVHDLGALIEQKFMNKLSPYDK